MKTIKFKIEGTRPLMLNNPQTVNPFNEYSKMLKPLTSKRTKTEDDLIEISRIKFISCWYINDGVYIMPQEIIWRSICEAAKERKLGKKFERSFALVNDSILNFKDKDKSPEDLFEYHQEYVDVRAVGIKNIKITTTRAIIQSWNLMFEAWYDESQIDEKEIVDVVEIAGLRYGLGTYRRLYGRFNAKKL